MTIQKSPRGGTFALRPWFAVSIGCYVRADAAEFFGLSMHRFL